jgi:hypothetical protein
MTETIQRCADCPVFQPANPDAYVGYCPKRKATRLGVARACDLKRGCAK